MFVAYTEVACQSYDPKDLAQSDETGINAYTYDHRWNYREDHMKLLVTGGAGYIGSHVTRQLSEAGHTVVVLDNLKAGYGDALIYDEKLVSIDLADLEKLDALFQAEQFDAVLHFAAFQTVSESVTHPIKYFRNNTCNTLGLVETCLANNVHRFIFSSTAAIYGSPVSGQADELSSPAPLNPYGQSKLLTEMMLEDIVKAHPLKYVALRYFNVAGADPECRMGQRTRNATHLIKVACETATGQRSHMEIYGTDYNTPDRTAIRDYIHIEDLSRAHLDALTYLENGGESTLLNVGYGHGYSVKEVIEEVQRASGVAFTVKEAGRRAGDAEQLIAVCDKIKAVLGWKPQFDNLSEIVSHAYRWEMKLKELKPDS